VQKLPQQMTRFAIKKMLRVAVCRKVVEVAPAIHQKISGELSPSLRLWHWRNEPYLQTWQGIGA